MIHLTRFNLMTQMSFLLTPSRLGLRDCFTVYTDNGPWMLAMFEISCTYFFYLFFVILHKAAGQRSLLAERSLF